jgi:hypothetical protein
MKKYFIILSLIISTATVAQTKKYEGSYFDVSYPSNFTATKCADANNCNEVTVTSPDQLVSFYVFAPQWNGTPNMQMLPTEKEVSREVKVVNKGTSQEQTITQVTYAAKDGSYTRSFDDTENTELNTRTTFGITYKNMAAYNKYKAQYLAFKKSLGHFAD